MVVKGAWSVSVWGSAVGVLDCLRSWCSLVEFTRILWRFWWMCNLTFCLHNVIMADGDIRCRHTYSHTIHIQWYLVIRLNCNSQFEHICWTKFVLQFYRLVASQMKTNRSRRCHMISQLHLCCLAVHTSLVFLVFSRILAPTVASKREKGDSYSGGRKIMQHSMEIKKETFNPCSV